MLATLVCGASIFTSCSSEDDPVTPPTDEVEAQLQKMTLREKVGQLFYVRPECLDTTIHFNLPSSVDVSSDDIREIKLQAVNATMRGVNEKYPVGGVILYAHNIEDEAQLSAFIPQIRALNGSPLLCIDEEGGRVARIANNGNFDVEKFESMGAIGATGDAQNAYRCGNVIGTYLHRYGFDIDFAPVADVNTNPENIIIGARAFSDDPQVAAPSWATRTSSSPTRWRWGPSPCNTRMPRLPWVPCRPVPTSCSDPRTSSKPSTLWSRPWRTACSPNNASTRASAASCA